MNANSLAPKTADGIKKETWYKLDCLAKYKLNSGCDNKKLVEWFNEQDKEWQASRKQKFNMRLNQRRW